MDLDYVVLALFVAGTVAAFFYRRTGKTPWRYAWLGLVWLENEVRKLRDRRKGKRGI